jgi:aldehyde dehydrogenase (NAD+)
MTVAAPTGLDLRALLTEGTHLIGGEWVPAWSGETFDVINPATQDVLLPVPRGGPDDIDAAATAAAAAFPPWRDTSPAPQRRRLARSLGAPAGGWPLNNPGADSRPDRYPTIHDLGT